MCTLFNISEETSKGHGNQHVGKHTSLCRQTNRGRNELYSKWQLLMPTLMFVRGAPINYSPLDWPYRTGHSSSDAGRRTEAFKIVATGHNLSGLLHLSTAVESAATAVCALSKSLTEVFRWCMMDLSLDTRGARKDFFLFSRIFYQGIQRHIILSGF